MCDRKFYRKVVEIEFLTEDKPFEISDFFRNSIMGGVNVFFMNAVWTGGGWKETIAEEIDGQTMARRLLAHGSDSECLREVWHLDDEGNDLLDEELFRWCQARERAGFLISSLVLGSSVKEIIEHMIPGDENDQGMGVFISTDEHELAEKGDPKALETCEVDCIRLLTRIAALTDKTEIGFNEDVDIVIGEAFRYAFAPIARARAEENELEILNDLYHRSREILAQHEDALDLATQKFEDLGSEDICIDGFAESVRRIVNEVGEMMPPSRRGSFTTYPALSERTQRPARVVLANGTARETSKKDHGRTVFGLNSLA
jgi:hypothetical protein